MSQVRISLAKQFSKPTIYCLLSCPKYIEDEVWGHCIQLGNKSDEVKMFHSTWLDKLQEVCSKHGFEIVVE